MAKKVKLVKKSWRESYNTLKEYYEKEFGDTYEDPKTGEQNNYYTFDEYQLEIDPDETKEEIENYDIERQKLEYKKCVKSFAYFCHKYVKILTTKKGLTSFILFEYQKYAVDCFEDRRFNIVSKFRQGGLTTVAMVWAVWRCLFKTDQQIVLMSRTDREATKAGKMADRAVEHLPSWLKPSVNKTNWGLHEKEVKETGSKISCYSPEAARGLTATFLFIDEAAHIKNMEEHWAAIYPTVSTGGNVVVISTVNGMGNWYYDTYMSAEKGENEFSIINIDYWENPFYNNAQWVKSQKANLGPKRWAQEVLRSFIGSGDTYISLKLIKEIDDKVKQFKPIRRLYPEWANQREIEEDEESAGALWIWKERVVGKEYIIAVDCADGAGDENDNSCFEIFDMVTLEQVAEFYSNKVPPHAFSAILKITADYYNTALVVIENMGTAGGAIVNAMEFEHHYEHLYREGKYIGVKLNTNRAMYLECLQNKIMNKSIIINSPRLTNELQTFIYIPSKKRAEAQKGKHDDAILATSMALFIKDTIERSFPVITNKEITTVGNAMKLELYEKIKNEIKRGIIEEEESDDDPLKIFNEDEPAFAFRRKHETILKEFGW